MADFTSKPSGHGSQTGTGVETDTAGQARTTPPESAENDASSADGSSLSIYERMVLAERRQEAALLGIRIDELEESLALQAALADQQSSSSTAAAATAAASGGASARTNASGSTSVGSGTGGASRTHTEAEAGTGEDLSLAALSSLSGATGTGGDSGSSSNSGSDSGSNSDCEGDSDAAPVAGVASTSSLGLASSNGKLGAVGNACSDNEALVWSRLPVELTVRVHSFLGDIDMCGIIPTLCRSSSQVGAAVGGERSRIGGLFQISEAVYKHYCQELFPTLYPHLYRSSSSSSRSNNNSCSNSKSSRDGNGSSGSGNGKAKPLPQLTLNRFSSWRHMALARPRLRLNGFYSIRSVYSKAPCNDNFWEPKKTKSVEVEFYRHMRFYENGDVLYSLNTKDPWDFPFGRNMQPTSKKIFAGKYKCKGKLVAVTVDTHYSTVSFELQVLDGCESYSNYAGNHSVLQIIKHSQVVGTGQAQSRWGMQLPVNCDMRYWRHWDFNYRDFPVAASP